MKNDQEKLTRLIGTLLDGQPPRRAPSSLQARVLAAVQARESASGWALGFTHWPRAAQIAFTLVALGVVKLTLLAAEWGAATLGTASLYKGAVHDVSWTWTLVEAVMISVRSIPELWLWGISALVASVYLGCLSISAVAYRALYAR
jgi:hypothetical protein